MNYIYILYKAVRLSLLALNILCVRSLNEPFSESDRVFFNSKTKSVKTCMWDPHNTADISWFYLAAQEHTVAEICLVQQFADNIGKEGLYAISIF